MGTRRMFLMLWQYTRESESPVSAVHFAEISRRYIADRQDEFDVAV